MLARISFELEHNKAFKSDLERVAFLICVRFGDYSALQRLVYCVARTLTRRYKLGVKNG